MKRILTLVLITLFAVQLSANPIKIEGGFNFSGTDIDYVSNENMGVGFNIGVTRTTFFNGIEIDSVISIVNKNSGFEMTMYGTTAKATINRTYLESKARFNFPVAPKTKLFIAPYAAFMIMQNMTMEAMGQSMSTDSVFDSLGLGVGFGGSYEVTNDMTINAGYSFGLLKVASDASESGFTVTLTKTI